MIPRDPISVLLGPVSWLPVCGTQALDSIPQGYLAPSFLEPPYLCPKVLLPETPVYVPLGPQALSPQLPRNLLSVSLAPWLPSSLSCLSEAHNITSEPLTGAERAAGFSLPGVILQCNRRRMQELKAAVSSRNHSRNVRRCRAAFQPTHHGYPPEGRDAFADGGEMIEHFTPPVSLSKSLDLLDLF